MNQSSYCSEFNHQLDILREKAGALEGLFLQFQRDLDNSVFDEALSDFEQEKQEFTNRLQEQTRNILVKWFETAVEKGENTPTKEEFRNGIVFDERGRATIGNNTSRFSIPSYQHFPNTIRKIIGKWDFEGNSKVKHLDFLEEVEGEFLSHHSGISSMKRLKSITGNGMFQVGSIKNLDSLETVSGILNLLHTNMTRLPKLKTVGEELGISWGKNHVVLSELTEVGSLSVTSQDSFFAPQLRHIRVSADFSSVGDIVLPNLKTVGHILKLDSSFFAGKLERVGGLQLTEEFSFHFASAFPSLREVQKRLFVRYTRTKQDIETLIRDNGLLVGTLESLDFPDEQ